jgi:hypothetical protein
VYGVHHYDYTKITKEAMYIDQAGHHLHPTKWQLMVYKKNQDRNFLGVFLALPSDADRIIVDYKIVLTGQGESGDTAFSASKVEFGKNGNSNWGWPKFIGQGESGNSAFSASKIEFGKNGKPGWGWPKFKEWDELKKYCKPNTNRLEFKVYIKYY